MNYTKYMDKIKKFFKSKKNIAILCLSFLLLVSLGSTGNSNNTTIENLQTQLKAQSDELEKTKKELSDEKNSDKSKQIETLQEANKILTDEKEKIGKEKNNIEKEKQSLEQEKADLQNQLEELKKTSSASASKSSSTTASSSSTSSQKNNTSSSSVDTNSEMVWVGQTGTKYHRQNCRTLKGKGHQITLSQALAEGREACKVCH